VELKKQLFQLNEVGKRRNRSRRTLWAHRMWVMQLARQDVAMQEHIFALRRRTLFLLSILE
ncbi:hypothetical protein A1A1_13602, partial [Planococcus antarcticus DSM 14505]